MSLALFALAGVDLARGIQVSWRGDVLLALDWYGTGPNPEIRTPGDAPAVTREMAPYCIVTMRRGQLVAIDSMPIATCTWSVVGSHDVAGCLLRVREQKGVYVYVPWPPWRRSHV